MAAGEAESGRTVTRTEHDCSGTPNATVNRSVWLGAISSVALAFSLFLLVTSVWMAVALRVIQGAAVGSFSTSATTLAIDLAPPGRHARAAARFTLVAYSGFAVGPVVAVWAAGRVGYSWCWVSGIVLAGVALAVIWNLPEVKPDRPPNAVASSKRRHLSSIVHPSSVVPGLVIAAGAAGWVSILSFYELFGRSIGLSSGAPIYLAFVGTLVVARLLAGGWADRWGRVAIGLPAIMVGATALTLMALASTPVATIVGAALYGISFGLLQPCMMTLTTDSAPRHQRGAAVGSFMAFIDVGNGLGAWAFGAVVVWSGYAAAYGTAAAACLAAAVLLALATLRRGRLKGGAHPGIDSARQLTTVELDTASERP